MIRIFRKTGQSSVEYVVLIIFLIGSLFAIGNYLKRGLQGRLKESVDGLADQYDPRYTTSNILQQVTANTMTTIYAVPIDPADPDSKKYTQRIDVSNMIETKTGATKVSLY